MKGKGLTYPIVNKIPYHITNLCVLFLSKGISEEHFGQVTKRLFKNYMWMKLVHHN